MNRRIGNATSSFIIAGLLLIVFSGLAIAGFNASPAAVIQGAYTPPPGSPERKAIMDAYRAEWMGGDQSRPVVFVVNYLKVRRGWAYTTVTPQSPDGSQNYETESGLLRKRNGQWKVLDRVAGNGDQSDFKTMRTKYPAAPSGIFP